MSKLFEWLINVAVRKMQALYLANVHNHLTKLEDIKDAEDTRFQKSTRTTIKPFLEKIKKVQVQATRR